jgi:CBS-domain-containing membrane protein
MHREFLPLPLSPLAPGARVREPANSGAARLTLESPAIGFMTDFTVVPAAVIEPAATVDESNRSMMRRGVRSLIVVDEAQRTLGILTATDVLGERSVKAALARGVARAEVLVRDVMTLSHELEVLALEDVRGVPVGRVVATLTRAGRQHGLVVEKEGQDEFVRGILSLSQIASAIGISYELSTGARSFAEIEAAVAGGR